MDPLFISMKKSISGGSCCDRPAGQTRTLINLLERASVATKTSNIRFNGEAVDIVFSGCEKFSETVLVLSNSITLLYLLSKQSPEQFANANDLFGNVKTLLTMCPSSAVLELLQFVSLVLPTSCSINSFIESQLLNAIPEFMSTSSEPIFKIYDFVLETAISSLTIKQLIAIYGTYDVQAKFKISEQLVSRVFPLPRASLIYLTSAIGPLYVALSGGIQGEFGLFFDDNFLYLYPNCLSNTLPDYCYPFVYFDLVLTPTLITIGSKNKLLSCILSPSVERNSSDYKEFFFQQLRTTVLKHATDSQPQAFPELSFEKDKIISTYDLISEKLSTIIPSLYADRIKLDKVPEQLIENIFRLLRRLLSYKINSPFLQAFNYMSMMRPYVQNLSSLPLSVPSMNAINYEVSFLVLLLAQQNIPGLDIYYERYLDVYNNVVQQRSALNVSQFVLPLYTIASLVSRDDKEFPRPLIKNLLNNDYSKLYKGCDTYIDIAIFQLSSAILSKASDIEKVKISQAIIRYKLNAIYSLSSQSNPQANELLEILLSDKFLLIDIDFSQIISIFKSNNPKVVPYICSNLELVLMRNTRTAKLFSITVDCESSLVTFQYKNETSSVPCNEVIESLSPLLKYMFLPSNDYNIRVILDKSKAVNPPEDNIAYMFNTMADGKVYKTRILCVDIMMHVVMADFPPTTAAIRGFQNLDPLITSLMTDTNNFTLNGAITTIIASLVKHKPTYMDKIIQIYPYNTLIKTIKQLFASAKLNEKVCYDDTGISGYILLLTLYPKVSALEKTENELFLNIVSLLQSEDTRTLKGSLSFFFSVLTDIQPPTFLQQYTKYQWLTNCFGCAHLPQISLQVYIKNIIQKCLEISAINKQNYFYDVITVEQLCLLTGMNDPYVLSETFHALATRYSISTQIDSTTILTPFIQGPFCLVESKLIGTNKIQCYGIISGSNFYIYQDDSKSGSTLVYILFLPNCSVEKKASDGDLSLTHVTITTTDADKTAITMMIKDKEAMAKWYRAISQVIDGVITYDRHESMITPQDLSLSIRTTQTPTSSKKKFIPETPRSKNINTMNFYFTPISLSNENITIILNNTVKQMSQLVETPPFYFICQFLSVLLHTATLAPEQIETILNIIQTIFNIASKLQKKEVAEKLQLRKFNYPSLYNEFQTSILKPLWMCQCCLSCNHGTTRCLVCNNSNQTPDPVNYDVRLFEETHSLCFIVLDRIYRLYGKSLKPLTINIQLYRSHSPLFLLSLPLLSTTVSRPLNNDNQITQDDTATPTPDTKETVLSLNFPSLMTLVGYLVYVEDATYKSYCGKALCGYLRVLVDSDPINMRNAIMSDNNNIKSIFLLMKTPVVEHQEYIREELQFMFAGFNYDKSSYEGLLHIFHYTLKHNMAGMFQEVSQTLLSQARASHNYFLSKYKSDGTSSILDKIVSVIESDYTIFLRNNKNVNDVFLSELLTFCHSVIVSVLKNNNNPLVKIKLRDVLLESLVTLGFHNSDPSTDGIIAESLFMMVYHCPINKIAVWELGHFVLSHLFENVVESKNDEALVKCLHLTIELASTPYIQHSMYESGFLFCTMKALTYINNLQTLLLCFQFVNRLLPHPIIASHFLTYYINNYKQFLQDYWNVPEIQYELLKMSIILIPSALLAVHFMNTFPPYLQLIIILLRCHTPRLQSLYYHYLHKIILGYYNVDYCLGIQHCYPNQLVYALLDCSDPLLVDWAINIIADRLSRGVLPNRESIPMIQPHPYSCFLSTDSSASKPVQLVLTEKEIYEFRGKNDIYPFRLFGYGKAQLHTLEDPTTELIAGVTLTIDEYQLKFEMADQKEYTFLNSNLNRFIENANAVAKTENDSIQTDQDTFYFTLMAPSPSIINFSHYPSLTLNELEKSNALSKIYSVFATCKYPRLQYSCRELLILLMKCDVESKFTAYQSLLAVKAPSTEEPDPPRTKNLGNSSPQKKGRPKLSLSLEKSALIPDDSRSRITVINGEPEYPFDVNVDIPILDYLRRSTLNTKYSIPNISPGEIPIIEPATKKDEILKTLSMNCIISSSDYNKLLIPIDLTKKVTQPALLPSDDPLQSPRRKSTTKRSSKSPSRFNKSPVPETDPTVTAAPATVTPAPVVSSPQPSPAAKKTSSKPKKQKLRKSKIAGKQKS